VKCRLTNSEIIIILNLSGFSAKEGIDYLLWQDDDKQIIDIENGIIVYNSHFPIRYLDNRKFAKVVINGETKGDFFVMGSFNRTTRRPFMPKNFPLDEIIWNKIVESILDWGNPEMVFKMTSQWE
jgi:hypothetical protein